MMGTSILSIPWGIKQVSPPLACTLVPSCLAPNAEEWCLALQAGFTLGILILIFTGLLMLYCCYIVLQAPKSIRESRTHLRFSGCTPATRRVGWMLLGWMLLGRLVLPVAAWIVSSVPHL